MSKEEYFGQLRIPSREEYEDLKQLVRHTPLQKAQYKAYLWGNNYVPESSLSRFFNFKPMVDKENRFDWEILYNLLLQHGEGKGWIKNGELTIFDYEKEIKSR